MALSLLSTERDVLGILEKLFPTNPDETKIRNVQEILNVIKMTDGYIRAKLYNCVGTDLTTTSWAGMPFADRNNQGNVSLLTVTLANTSAPITETWTIKFTSSTAFTLTGSMSGSNGTGSTAAAFASTDTYYTIAAASWSGTPNVGDKIYFNTYDIDAVLVECSALRAAAHLLDSVYAEEVAGASDYAARFEERAQKILDEFCNPDYRTQLPSKGETDVDVQYIQKFYDINTDGEDDTSYADDDA